MRRFPAFVAQDVRLEGRGYLDAAADITLSSAGNPVLLGSDPDPHPHPPVSTVRLSCQCIGFHWLWLRPHRSWGLRTETPQQASTRRHIQEVTGSHRKSGVKRK